MRLRALFVLALLFLVAPFARAAWINDPAPVFQLPDLSGQPTALGNLKGKVVFLNFWASWCPPCKQEFPKVNELAAAYNGKNVAVLAVSLDKTPGNIDTFLRKIGMSPLKVTILRDAEGKAARDYSARAMPITYVIDKQGVIRFVHMGFQKDDEAKWRQEVDTLLKEGDR